jgi:hypothetical protein
MPHATLILHRHSLLPATRPLLVALLALCIFDLIPSLVAQAPSKEPFTVFKINGDISEDNFQILSQKIKDDLGKNVVTSPVFASNRLLVVKSIGDVNDLYDSISKLLLRIAPKSSLERIQTVMRDGVPHIPTGLVTVQFKSHASQTMIHNLLHTLNLVILHIPNSDPSGPLVVRDRNGNVSRALKAIVTLQKSCLVEYAEADFVQRSG